MSKTYRFECIERDDETCATTTTLVEIDGTEKDAWSGFDGPMYKFFDFLRGCGFVFGTNSQIGVMTDKGKFEPAADF